jgi:hypothetical protein
VLLLSIPYGFCIVSLVFVHVWGVLGGRFSRWVVCLLGGWLVGWLIHTISPVFVSRATWYFSQDSLFANPLCILLERACLHRVALCDLVI